MFSVLTATSLAHPFKNQKDRDLVVHEQLYNTAMILADCHIDTLSKLLDLDDPNVSLREPRPEHHVDLPRLQQAHMKLQVFSIFTMPYEIGHYGTVRALRMMQVYRDEVRRFPDTFGLVQSRHELAEVEHGAKSLYGIFSMEGASPLCGDLRLLEVFFTMGLRAIGLTWNHRNELADGLGVESAFGLTPFGKEVIQRMNQLGMVVDLAHINAAGFWQAMELSNAPVIVSHANAKTLCSHRRNMTDEQLDAIRDKNGFIGICFAGGFLTENPQEACLEDVIRHIDYMCERIGPAHVAFGSDYDGIRVVPKDLEDVSRFPILINRLKERGYSQSDLELMAFRNVVRVYQQVLP